MRSKMVAVMRAQCDDVARVAAEAFAASKRCMIRKIKSGDFRIYSRHADKKTGKRKNLGTFSTREGAEKHEQAIQYFKHG